MDVKELSLAWAKLVQVGQGHNTRLNSELSNLLLQYRASSFSFIIGDVEDILNRFWEWAASKLKPQDWESSDIVKPWLQFQALIGKEYPKFNNYHHSFLYQTIINQYHLSNVEFCPKTLLKLLAKYVDLVGLSEESLRVSNYPLNRLNLCGEDINKAYEIIAFATILFYLTHYYLNKSQRKLIPLLIQFNENTNDEVKRSEKDIFSCLLKKGQMVDSLFYDSNNLNAIGEIMARANNDSEMLTDGIQLLGMNSYQAFHLIRLFIHPTKKVEELAGKISGLFHLEDAEPNEILVLTKRIRNYCALLELTAPGKKERIENALVFLRVKSYIIKRQYDDKKNNTLSLFGLASKIKAAEECLDKFRTGSAISYISQWALDQGDLKRAIDWSIDKFEELPIEPDLTNDNLGQLKDYLANPNTNDIEVYAKLLFTLFYPTGATANQTLFFSVWLRRVTDDFIKKDVALFNDALTCLRIKAYDIYRRNKDESMWGFFSKQSKLAAAKERIDTLKSKDQKAQPSASSSGLWAWVPAFGLSWPKATDQGELATVLDGSAEQFKDPEAARQIVVL